MGSYIKIKSLANIMNEDFINVNSPYYYIKYFNGDDNKEIIFECLIRHNEIGNKKLQRAMSYTFKTLEKILKKKCKEYADEQKDINLKNNYIVHDYVCLKRSERNVA